MTPVEWTRPARDDLDRIDSEFAAVDPEFADRVGNAAITTGRFLSSWPRSGALLDDGEIRKWRVKTTPYLLIYRVLDDRIQILRVRHEREDWQAAA